MAGEGAMGTEGGATGRTRPALETSPAALKGKIWTLEGANLSCRRSPSRLILQGLPVAFGTISRGGLLGAGGPTLGCFCFYLTNSFQKLVLGDCCSAPWDLCCGVL